MEILLNDFSEKLDKQIIEINKLNKGNVVKTMAERVDYLLLGMGLIERSFNKLINFKEQNLNYDLTQVINYDYDLSSYAERYYSQGLQVIGIISKNIQNPIIKLIPMSKKETLLNLNNRMMQISARWHIERIINFYEFETPAKDKAFPKRKALLQECIFFADRMNASKMGIKFDDGIMPKRIIFATQPSSGKSFVANVYSLMTLCLHRIYYRTSGILRMSNNASNACGFSEQIKAMIENEKISIIYPEFKEYFSSAKPKILEKSPSDEWKIMGLDPRIRASHFSRGVEQAINSIRIFCALIIDDLSNGFDQMKNDEAHQNMSSKYFVDMKSRAEGGEIPEFILGTMFNEFDIQNTLIMKLENEVGLIKDENYKDVRRTPDYTTIVIEVDCFDVDGTSKAPKLISTEELKERQNALKPYEFDLVYRQIRSSREPRIFDYNNLKTYTKLPETLSGNRIAVLDPTRRNGADYFALPVFALDSETSEYYFIDCIYEQKSLGKLSDPYNIFLKKVVKFLYENNVTQFYIENNTSNTIGTIFEDKFKKINFNCKILEFFTAREKYTKNKLERILNEEATITSNIQFPASNLYPPLHRISQFMTDFTRFDSKMEGGNKKQHDDAPDSVAIFSKRCLFNKQNRYSSVTSFDKNKIFRKYT